MEEVKAPFGLREDVLPRMKELIRDTWASVRGRVNPHGRKHAFEVFGYAFMLDSAGQLFLIEINTNPCLEESSPLLEGLIPRMISKRLNALANAEQQRGSR